jgi:hypothetical protein
MIQAPPLGLVPARLPEERHGGGCLYQELREEQS